MMVAMKAPRMAFATTKVIERDIQTAETKLRLSDACLAYK